MASKKFEIVRPKSLTNPELAAYEYVIRWVGRDGSDYLYMFYDAVLQNKVSNTVINPEDCDRIESLIDSESRSVTLTANDLSRNDLDVMGQMFANKFVQRLNLDGTIERYAPDANSYTKKESDGRYDVSFTLIRTDLKVWK